MYDEQGVLKLQQTTKKMRTNVLAEGGKRPPTSRDKQPSIADSGSNPTSQFLLEGSLSDEIPQQLTSSFKTQREYLALPVKRWPYILTIKSNPIMPKDVIYNQSVAPWTRSFHNDGVKRIDRITYFGGILRVYLTDSIWLSNLKDFVKSKLPRDVFSVEEITQRVQFMANGLQPNLAAEDKVEFEKLFNVKIKFFLNSRRSGTPISIAMVEGSRQVRDDLCKKMHSIKMTIFFLTATFATNGDTGFNIAPIRIPRNVFTVLRQVILLKIAQTSQSKDVSIAMDNTVFYKGCPEFKNDSAGWRPAVAANSFAVPLHRATTLSKDTTILKSSDSKDSHRLPPSQLVTMEILEERLEESCNKLLTVMQARFTETIVAFERKLSTLIGNLSTWCKAKKSECDGKNSHGAKKLNVDSSINHSDIEDVVMEVEETDSEYVNKIINTQSSLINNGTAALISDEVARI
ncbi:hypothetical protein ACOME3_004959 [Neoechinorhynchus agilis]